MNRTGITKAAIVILLIFAMDIYAQDSLYPEGYNIDVRYSIDETIFAYSDTLHIIRSITNNTNSVLRNLYWDELIPQEFDLVSYDIGINGSEIAYYFNRRRNSSNYPGYFLYEWVIDYPDDSDTANVVLRPSQTLELSLKFVCDYPGSYAFPFHSACFVNTETEFFTIAPETAVEVYPYVNINDGQTELPDRANLSIAYPNPFNGEVVFKLSTGNLIDTKSGELYIYDPVGRLVYKTEFVGEKSLRWHPAEDLAGGIYFYSITAEEITTTGKIVYLK